MTKSVRTFFILVALIACGSDNTSGLPAEGKPQRNTHLGALEMRSVQQLDKSDPNPQPLNFLPVELIARPDAKGDVAIVFRNRYVLPVRLQSQLYLEREERGRWKEQLFTGVSLRYSCDEEPEPCLTLVPGGELHPPIWSTRSEGAQCGHISFPHLPAGRYRLVVKECQKHGFVSSDLFTIE